MDLFNIKSWFSENLQPEPNFQQPVQGYENTFFELTNFSIGSDQINDKKLVFDGYITNVDVYSINKRICDSIAEIPIELYKYTLKDKIEIENGDFYELFRKPNSKQSLFQATGELLDLGLLKQNVTFSTFHFLRRRENKKNSTS